MRYSSSLALAAAVASFAVAGANPTLTNGAAKRFEPSTGPACHYVRPMEPSRRGCCISPGLSSPRLVADELLLPSWDPTDVP